MKLTEQQQQILDTNGYYNGRVIDGKLVALCDYAFTTGIVIGIDEVGYERRYCYATTIDAKVALGTYNDITQHPDGNWIKCKGRFNGEPIDLLNPNLKA